ncbi:S8 family peptidase [Brevibacillus sp. SYSU BS000544]|uniref:S8 family peptidase n=1 Tax=Brevibacillus sp. SYSU BS000544 TaxID=3416443 RepID=UPI003CE589C3
MKWMQKSMIMALSVPLLFTGFMPKASAWESKAVEKLNQQQQSYVTGELIIKYKDDSIGIRKSKYSQQVQVKERMADMELVKVPADTLTEVASEIAKDPNVEYVEPNYIYRVAASDDQPPVNDERYKEQWGLPAVEAPAAWNKLGLWEGPKLDKVVVAVVDTGVSVNHPDLGGRVLNNGYNAIDDNQNVNDVHGHGTHVSGIIAAQTNNEIGVAGVTGTAPISILPIKVLDDNGFGTTVSIAKGIDKAVELGADVINMSLGGQGYSKLMQESIQKAVDKGVVVVVAAGNSSDDADGYFPAGYPEPVTVASSNSKGNTSDFSNFGSPIDLIAPGEDVLSTVTDGEYEYYSGTSMASPFVAGAAALVKLTHPDWDVQQIRTALENTAKDIDKPGFDASTGHGLLQVNQALSYGENAPLQIVKPSQGTQVFGKVDFQIKVKAAQATQVQLLSNSNKVLGSYPVVNNQANFAWDSAQVSDGNQLLSIRTLDASGQVIGQAETLQLRVYNKDTAGIKVQVTSPDGKIAQGAFVQVLRYVDYGSKYDDENGSKGYYRTVLRSYTNGQGIGIIPAGVILKNEKYLLVVEYYDSDLEKEYVTYQPLQGNTGTLALDFSQTQEVSVQVTKDEMAYQTDHADFYFTPMIDGAEVDRLTIRTSADEKGNVKVNLPPGDYTAFAVRNGEQGQNYLLQQSIHVEKETKAVAFDISKTKKLTFALPKWASSAEFYAETGSYYTYGMHVGNGKSILMSPQVLEYYWIDLKQEKDDMIWFYSLRTDEELDVTKDQKLVIPSNPEIKLVEDEDDEDYEDDEGTEDDSKDEERIYHPGDFLRLPFIVSFGNNFELRYVENIPADVFKELQQNAILVKEQKDEKTRFIAKDHAVIAPSEDDEEEFEEAEPTIIMTNEQGQEVWQEAGFRYFEIPSNYNITAGKYKIDVDFTKVPLQMKEPRKTVKELKLELEGSTAQTQVALVSPDRQPVQMADVYVLDSEQKVVSSDYYYHWDDETDYEEASFNLDDLKVGEKYTFHVNGTLKDNTPFMVERSITVPSNRFTLDLSQKSTKPSKVKLPTDDDLYLTVAKGEYHLPVYDYENGIAPEAWIDPGTYQLTAIKKLGEQQFIYRTDMVIDKPKVEIEVKPDFSAMDKVTIASKGKENIQWMLGVLSEEEEDEDDYEEYSYVVFELTSSDTLYLPKENFQFRLAKMQSEDGMTTGLFYDAKPRKVKDGYEFKVDSKLTAGLKLEEKNALPGKPIHAEVLVQDSYKNRLNEVVIMADNPAKDIQVPLKLTVDKQGKSVIYAFDASKREYEPISSQDIMPVLTLEQDGKILAESKESDNWYEGSIQLPADAAKGTYTLKWQVDLPGELSAETEVIVPEMKRYTFKELLADDSKLFKELTETVPMDQILVFFNDEYIDTLEELIEEDELDELLKEDEANDHENIIAVVPVRE